MLAGAEFGRIVAGDAAILISDLQLDEPQTLLPLMVGVMRAGHRALLLIAERFSDDVKTFILANRESPKFAVIPVRTPFSTPDEQLYALRDAMREGIVPGAGTALLLCAKGLGDDGGLPERAAGHILRGGARHASPCYRRKRRL